MAKSFDKMTKDELLQYKKEVEQKLKEKEEAELLIANQCKQIGFTSLMRQAKTDSVLAKKMVEALNKELSANEKIAVITKSNLSLNKFNINKRVIVF